MRWVGGADAGASLTSTDRVKDVEETANTILDFDFTQLPRLMSPSVPYEALVHALWWSRMFPGRLVSLPPSGSVQEGPQSERR